MSSALVEEQECIKKKNKIEIEAGKAEVLQHLTSPQAINQSKAK